MTTATLDRNWIAHGLARLEFRWPILKRSSKPKTSPVAGAGRADLIDLMQGHPEAYLGELNFQETMAWYSVVR